MTTLGTTAYVGRELELFAAATNWKAYIVSHITAYLGDEVVEVGAGFGGTTKILCGGGHKRWVCVEPDALLAERLRNSILTGDLPPYCEAVVGTIEQLGPAQRFDTVVYIDVLEHIEDDRAELARAAGVLRRGGHVIALSPAHGWLYTPFDKVIGHHRRYTKKTLAAITPPDLELVKLIYLDSVGMGASMGNRFLLKQSMPTESQLAVWDKLLVPASRVLDPLLRHSLGKSVLAVWRKNAGDDRVP